MIADPRQVPSLNCMQEIKLNLHAVGLLTAEVEMSLEHKTQNTWQIGNSVCTVRALPFPFLLLYQIYYHINGEVEMSLAY